METPAVPPALLAAAVMTLLGGAVAGCFVSFEDVSGAGGQPSGGAGGAGGAGAGGVGAGGAGSGGTAGDGGAVATEPGDWSTLASVLYTFEGTDFGVDVSGNGPSLDLTGSSVDVVTMNPPQGDQWLDVGTNEHVRSASELSLSGAVSWGGWVRTPINGNNLTAFGAYEDSPQVGSPNGVELRRHSATTRFGCHVYNDGQSLSLLAGTWTVNTDYHVVCRFDSNTGVLAMVVNGIPEVDVATDAALDFKGIDELVHVGSSTAGDGLPGNLDEVFVYPGALGVRATRRIYACGFDGSLCTCDPTSPEEYTNCGRLLLNECTNITPCNAQAPGGE